VPNGSRACRGPSNNAAVNSITIEVTSNIFEPHPQGKGSGSRAAFSDRARGDSRAHALVRCSQSVMDMQPRVTGEVCLTAIETNLKGVFRFKVRKDMKLRWPRVETTTHFITMGLHESLDEDARRATKEMIDYLVTARGLSRDDAYTHKRCRGSARHAGSGWCKGVHAMLPKSIFRAP
jgi:hypothetical protein